MLLLLAGLVGCAPWAPAPVEDRSQVGERPRQTEPASRRVAQPPPPVYEVTRGDTLYSIAFRYGLDWRDVAQWNRIEPPYTIRPGQSLRMTRPPTLARSTAQREPEPASRTEPEPLPPSQPRYEPQAEPEPAAPAETSTRPDTSESRAPAPAASARSVRGVEWQWPTDGRVERPFDASATRRGIGISGSGGQAVVAAAAGEVVYSGTALIGYGELIIIKHSDTLLSAYGHNRVRMVREGDRVRRGEQIAELGINERNEEVLHFEIRRNGQPEDPLGYLPRR